MCVEGGGYISRLIKSYILKIVEMCIEICKQAANNGCIYRLFIGP